MSTPKPPVLTIDGGPDDGKTIRIDTPAMTLGRLEDNDVVVRGSGVSRTHAEIVRTDAGYCLRDLGSTNGTFVNGTSIGQPSHPLRQGDDIRLGTSKVSLVFRTDESATVTMTAVAPEPGREALKRVRLTASSHCGPSSRYCNTCAATQTEQTGMPWKLSRAYPGKTSCTRSPACLTTVRLTGKSSCSSPGAGLRGPMPRLASCPNTSARNMTNRSCRTTLRRR